MTNVFIVISAIVSAIATGVIAYYAWANDKLTKNTLSLTEATLKLNESIKTSTDQHQEDMKKLQIDLVAASLWAATQISGQRLYRESLKEFRKIVTDSI
ncbi:MAG: hypothetical protein ACLQGU_19765 [bacterium]